MSSNCGIHSYQKIPYHEGILIIIWGKNVILQQSDHLTYLLYTKNMFMEFQDIIYFGKNHKTMLSEICLFKASI